ncbi:hypothetical protein IWQ62_002863 [Dispira parvispora]|uniref:ABC transporter domain-containing protein n=1 Tax=Dispira parvispora TaxID=1520584 RepID=A0A9W8API3_9FUNG|nr:hypothetical protein IWQ62_002863 [Dispira parvispora]
MPFMRDTPAASSAGDVAVTVDGFLSDSQDKVQPLQIVFKDLCYSVTVKGNPKENYQPLPGGDPNSDNAVAPPAKSRNPFRRNRGPRTYEKQILSKITGAFQPGRLTAILGPSGSGKSSLLNLMAGSAHQGQMSGDIFLNGRHVTGQGIRLVSGYVFQDDVILATMTVLEAITMCATLRCPDLTPEQRKDRVDEIISLLELDKARNTIIGDARMKGVSGGERKRCAIAMEMVTNPSVLFLDEPTSGLDAYTAMTVTHLLRELARAGRTIVTVMHQPSSEIFHMFDDVMILQEGHTVYFGPAEHAIDYFARAGYQCPLYTNPADFFFMNVLYQFDPTHSHAGDRSESGTGAGITEKGRLEQLQTYWQTSPEAAYQEQVTQNPLTCAITPDMLKKTSSFMLQYSLLLKRAGYNALRNKMVVQAKIYQALFFAVFIGLIFLNIPGKDKITSQIQDMQGALFFVSVNQFMNNAFPVVTTFSSERNVFRREYGSKLYSLPAYFLSKNTVEGPFLIIVPFIFAAITYWMFGFQADAGKFFIFAAGCVCLAICGVGYGTLVACAFENMELAMIIMPVTILPLMIFGGLLVNTGTAPAYLAWIQWISPIKYAFSAFAINQFTGYSSQGQDVGDSALEALDLGPFGILVNIIFLIGLFLILYGLAYLALWRLVDAQSHSSIYQNKLSPKKQLLSPPGSQFSPNEDHIPSFFDEKTNDGHISSTNYPEKPHQLGEKTLTRQASVAALVPNSDRVTTEHSPRASLTLENRPSRWSIGQIETNQGKGNVSSTQPLIDADNKHDSLGTIVNTQ